MIQKNITFYSKFLGSLIKKGNKVKATNILNESLKQTSLKIKRPIHFLLRKMSSKLHCTIEARKVKVRKNVHIVPFVLNVRRQRYLKVKWILEEVRKNKNKIKIVKKLSSQFIDLLKNKNSKILLKKKTMLKEAIINQSNIHYRW